MQQDTFFGKSSLKNRINSLKSTSKSKDDALFCNVRINNFIYFFQNVFKDTDNFLYTLYFIS